MLPCIGRHWSRWGALTMLLLCLCWCAQGVWGGLCDGVHVEPINRISHPQMLIGIGTPKSGTTFIYNALRTHPKIVKSRFKELHGFDHQGFKPSQPSYDKYMGYWGGKEKLEKGDRDRVLLEITPRYLELYDVPCAIKHFVPDAKFLVTLRHPVDRSMSHINMNRRTCIATRRSNPRKPLGCCRDVLFDTVPKLAASIQNMRDASQQCLNVSATDPWHGCPIGELKPLERNLYSTQLAHWFKVFPPSQFIFINANELFQDPVKQLNRVLDFVGLPTDWDLEQYVDDVKKYKASVEIVDPEEAAIKQMIGEAFEEPLQDFYRLLEENGIGFSPLQMDPEHNKDVKTIPLSRVKLLCCKGGCPYPRKTDLLRFQTKYKKAPQHPAPSFPRSNSSNSTQVQLSSPETVPLSTAFVSFPTFAALTFPVFASLVWMVWRKDRKPPGKM